MALFDYKSYLKNIPRTVEGLTEAAEFMLAKDSPFSIGNATPKSAAKGILSSLSAIKTNVAQQKQTAKSFGHDFDEAAVVASETADYVKLIDKMLNSNSGSISWKRYYASIQDQQKDIKEQIGEASEWLANRLDFSGKDVTEAQKQSALNAKSTIAKQKELEEKQAQTAAGAPSAEPSASRPASPRGEQGKPAAAPAKSPKPLKTKKYPNPTANT